MPKVSIIITCYNLGMYLEEALHSALAQTYPDFEVVLIDDGSTDPATIALLDRLPPHPRLRVLRTPNQGVARARNYGIAQSCGAYILPLDADDRILPDYLTYAVPVLDQRPEVGFVGCYYHTFGARQASYQPAHYRLPRLLIDNEVPISSLFRRICWEQAGGYCPEVSFEDWDLWLTILGLGYQGYVIPRVLFEYRVRPSSRHEKNQQPDIYQAALKLIRQRHRMLYERHLDDVLDLKDMQFATLLIHSRWLEQQRLSWEQAARNRLATIETLNKRAGRAERRRVWWHLQVSRVRWVMAENPSAIGRIRAIGRGIGRIMRRKIQHYFH